jgi:hypothetical protein
VWELRVGVRVGRWEEREELAIEEDVTWFAFRAVEGEDGGEESVAGSDNGKWSWIESAMIKGGGWRHGFQFCGGESGVGWRGGPGGEVTCFTERCEGFV